MTLSRQQGHGLLPWTTLKTRVSGWGTPKDLTLQIDSADIVAPANIAAAASTNDAEDLPQLLPCKPEKVALVDRY